MMQPSRVHTEDNAPAVGVCEIGCGWNKNNAAACFWDLFFQNSSFLQQNRPKLTKLRKQQHLYHHMTDTTCDIEVGPGILWHGRPSAQLPAASWIGTIELLRNSNVIVDNRKQMLHCFFTYVCTIFPHWILRNSSSILKQTWPFLLCMMIGWCLFRGRWWRNLRRSGLMMVTFRHAKMFESLEQHRFLLKLQFGFSIIKELHKKNQFDEGLMSSNGAICQNLPGEKLCRTVLPLEMENGHVEEMEPLNRLTRDEKNKTGFWGVNKWFALRKKLLKKTNLMQGTWFCIQLFGHIRTKTPSMWRSMLNIFQGDIRVLFPLTMDQSISVLLRSFQGILQNLVE